MYKEKIPQWLAEATESTRFDSELFFGSGTVFYPGSGTDGQPLALFNRLHWAHCYVFADFGISPDALRKEFMEHGFEGYEPLALQELSIDDVIKTSVKCHIEDQETPNRSELSGHHSYGLFTIFTRGERFGEDHGAEKFALLFLGADGIATYDALYCQERSKRPFGVVIQDHGFGGNYDRFGRDGLLEKIAIRCKTYPEWLLVGENSDPWIGYDRFENIPEEKGGMHSTLRSLYRRLK